MARGEYDTALEFLGHSRRIYEKLKLESELSRIFFLLGELYYRRRDLFSARQFLNRTLENATLQDDWLLMGESHRVLAKVFLEEDDHNSATTSFRRAVELLEKHGNPIFLARVCQDYALFLSESERPETQKEGLALMERALELFAKAGAGLLARKADVMVKKFRRRYRDRSLAQRDAISFDGLVRLRDEAGQKFTELLREAETKMNTDGFSDKVLEEVRADILQARSELFGQIDNLSQQNQRLQQDIDFLMEEKNNLSLLQEISRTINSELDLNRLISKVLDMVIEVLQAERGFLLLRNKDGKLTIRTARNSRTGSSRQACSFVARMRPASRSALPPVGSTSVPVSFSASALMVKSRASRSASRVVLRRAAKSSSSQAPSATVSTTRPVPRSTSSGK